MAYANSPPGKDDAEIVNDLPGAGAQRPIILPKVAFNSSTTLESPAFWFVFGMLAGFAVVYVIKKS